MTSWGLAGATYGLVLAFAALTQPIRRRHLAFVASVAFTLVALAAGTLTTFWVNLVVPGILLLCGYWLSGFFFRDPQAWLETWLLRVDHAARAERWLHWAPWLVAELLELSYTMVYIVVGGGAIYVATFGTDAVVYYWSLVLASELASYAPLPWLRSRPPRVIDDIRAKPGRRAEGPPSAKLPSARSAALRRLNTLLHDTASMRGPYLRRLNTAILDTASIQANTLPSGHVSGAVAAALGVMAADVVAGWWLIAAAGAIAVASVAGRYHYLVDCIAGAAVAFALWLLV